jgi:hypothetical protein
MSRFENQFVHTPIRYFDDVELVFRRTGDFSRIQPNYRNCLADLPSVPGNSRAFRRQAIPAFLRCFPGWMFWFTRKKLSGSYFALIVERRS